MIGLTLPLNFWEEIINNLINKGDIKNSKIMEIGCGNGQFLIKLMKELDKSNTGYGFDPSYKKNSSILENNIVEEINEKEALFRKMLVHEKIKSITGKGLMLSIDLNLCLSLS